MQSFSAFNEKIYGIEDDSQFFLKNALSYIIFFLLLGILWGIYLWDILDKIYIILLHMS
jgi:hypothetical protein